MLGSTIPGPKDEELVCIAENNSCSVDAVQSLLGCTTGKGNLILVDNGKQAFTFYSRDQNRAMRIYFQGDVFGRMDCTAAEGSGWTALCR